MPRYIQIKNSCDVYRCDSSAKIHGWPEEEGFSRIELKTDSISELSVLNGWALIDIGRDISHGGFNRLSKVLLCPKCYKKFKAMKDDNNHLELIKFLELNGTKVEDEEGKTL